MHVTLLDQLTAGGATLVAGAVNALAGGGTLISFPALVGLGVPAVAANVTNTVALVPGYLAGSYAQREQLATQMSQARLLAIASALGGLAGSILLISIPGHAFRTAIPYLILLACLLLLTQDRVRARLAAARATKKAADRPSDSASRELALPLLVFVGAVYGGFFGAGLGIMLLAMLGILRSDPLPRLNALKQALSFVINLVAAAFFLFSGHVLWALVPVMAIGALIGGTVGGRLADRVPAKLLRTVVILAGAAIAIGFWVT